MTVKAKLRSSASPFSFAHLLGVHAKPRADKDDDREAKDEDEEDEDTGGKKGKKSKKGGRAEDRDDDKEASDDDDKDDKEASDEDDDEDDKKSKKSKKAKASDDEECEEELYQKAQALVAQGDLDGAVRQLEAILRLSPDYPLAHNDLAVIYYQEGSKEEALFHYEKAAALAPGNSIFQKNLADFYFVEGRDIDGAIAIYLKLLEKEPKNIETLMNLGRICTILERPEEARTFYGKVAQLEPWNRDARECLTTLRQCANG